MTRTGIQYRETLDIYFDILDYFMKKGLTLQEIYQKFEELGEGTPSGDMPQTLRKYYIRESPNRLAVLATLLIEELQKHGVNGYSDKELPELLKGGLVGFF